MRTFQTNEFVFQNTELKKNRQNKEVPRHRNVPVCLPLICRICVEPVSVDSRRLATLSTRLNCDAIELTSGLLRCRLISRHRLSLIVSPVSGRLGRSARPDVILQARDTTK